LKKGEETNQRIFECFLDMVEGGRKRESLYALLQEKYAEDVFSRSAGVFS